MLVPFQTEHVDGVSVVMRIMPAKLIGNGHIPSQDAIGVDAAYAAAEMSCHRHAPMVPLASDLRASPGRSNSQSQPIGASHLSLGGQ